MPLIQHKTEVKFLVSDFRKLPSDIVTALKNGDEHEEILARGFVVQDYLAVSRKNILRIYQELLNASILPATDERIDQLTSPGKIQEIRLMRKCVKVGRVVKEVYQVAIQGQGGISNIKIETPEILDEVQLLKMKQLFVDFFEEVNDRVYKLYFEIPLKAKNNALVFDSLGQLRTVEIDVFLKNQDGIISPIFINGEIKFREIERDHAIASATQFRENCSLHPSYFENDVTERVGFKVRNIALTGLPVDMKEHYLKCFFANFIATNSIAAEFKTWASPEIASLIFTSPPKQLGVYLNKKILLNAESFGFGPTAAISEIFPYLRNRTSHLSYIGSGHTLDLQNKLPYDEVFDIGNNPHTRKKNFTSIARNYDIFITASDFEAAQWAKELGLKLVIYDPLTWYWAKIPAVIRDADFYVAQNFFGVEKRLSKESECFPDYAIVPSIISGMNDAVRNERESLLVNMGGLSNPYIDQQGLEVYARVVFESVNSQLKQEMEETTYITSKAIAAKVQDICPAATLQPHEVQAKLSSSSLAIMTSGLGNIYEASAMKKKVIWLPPANDSQGQQIKLLQQHGMVDYLIDWADLFEDDIPIDYFATQEIVMQQIAIYMRRLSQELIPQQRFKMLLLNHFKHSQTNDSPVLSGLAEVFEIHGAKQTAENILQWAVQ